MGFFDAPELNNHEQVVFAKDDETGLKAIIGIHNTSLGPALGGCRVWNYETKMLHSGMSYDFQKE